MAKNYTRKVFYKDCSWTAPIEVTSVSVTSVPANTKSVAAGNADGFARWTTGLVFGFGSNQCGKLGDGTMTDPRPTPVAVASVWGGIPWRTISAGLCHTVGILYTGYAFGWGYNNDSTIGDGTATNRCGPTIVCCDYLWKGIGAGQTHTIGLRADGCVFTWGTDTNGVLGDGTTVGTRPSPAPICGNLRFRYVSASQNASTAISTDGDGYVWGNNSYGQIGDGTATSKCCPTLVTCGLKFKMLEAGWGSTFGIAENGDLYAWGHNCCGNLGIGSSQNYACVPTLVCGGLKWKQVTAGKTSISFISAGVTCAGELYTWGSNVCGSLGLGSILPKCTPTQVCCSITWREVAIGTDHMLAITEDGILWGWGSANNGRLGESTLSGSYCSPTCLQGAGLNGPIEPQHRKVFPVTPTCPYCIKVNSTYVQFNGTPIADYSVAVVLEYFS